MKKIFKRTLLTFLASDVIIWLFLQITPRHKRIILYHGVSDSPDELRSSQVIEPSVFAMQLAYLKQHYNVIPLRELTISDKLPPYSVAITFDDGYENNYRVAAPLLKQNGLTAAIFVNPRLVDQAEGGKHRPAWWDIIDYLLTEQNRERFVDIFNRQGIKIEQKIAMEETLKELPAEKVEAIIQALLEEFAGEMAGQNFPRLMTWRQLKELAGAGFEIGAHTMSHLSVVTLPAERLQAELVEPKKIIEDKLGVKVKTFAFPFGGDTHFSESALELLKKADYRAALLVSGRSSDPFCLSRVSIHKSDDFRLFKIKAAGIYDDLYILYKKLKKLWKRN